MSAAEQRAAFADVGRDLLAARGKPGERRAAPLLAPDSDGPPAEFDRLTAVPEWLRWPADRQGALARAVALRALAPALAASIDGAWLGRIASMTGEEALDWAIACGANDQDGSDVSISPPAPDDLAAAGFATLRAALPADLRHYVADGTSAAPLLADTLIIDEAVAFVATPRERPQEASQDTPEETREAA